MSKKDQTDAPDDTPAPGEAAEVAEVEKVTTITVTWNGRDWTVPANYGLVDAVAFRGLTRLGQLGDGASAVDIADAVDVVESLLGRGQFRTWSNGSRCTVADAFDLIRAVFAAWGTPAGE